MITVPDLPGNLAWHVTLVLASPALLGLAAALACHWLPGNRLLAWVAIGPALLLQALMVKGAALAPELAPPATWLLRPGYASAIGGLVAGLAAACWWRPSSAEPGRGLSTSRWCLVIALALAIPLCPLALLIPLAVEHSTRPAWHHPMIGRLVWMLAMAVAPLWVLAEPGTADLAQRLTALTVLAAARPGPAWGFSGLALAASMLGWWR